MMTIDASQWDETICDMIACQHPPCWEALRRVEKGVPRILLRIPGRDSPESGDELPTLKIVNLPFEYSQNDHIKCTESLTSISKTISNIRNTRSFYSSSTLNEALFPPMSVPSSEKNLAPGLNSRVESRTPYYTPIGFSFWRQAEEVSGLDMFVDPSLDQQIHQSALIVRWIPGTRQKLLQPENSATSIKTSTQRLCVKDLALESILSLTEKQEIKRKKSSKVPTGGQPYLLHLKKNQNVRSGRSSNPTGKERNQKVGPSRKRQHRPNQLQLNPIALLQSDSALDLENSKGTLSESKEKLVLPFIVKKAPSLNKFDSKVSMKEKGLRKTQSKEFAEKGLQSEVSAPLATSRGKTSAKSVEYKSSKNDLTMEGCDNSVHWISRSKTNYNVYCKITAKQKGAALAQDIHLAGSREQRPKGATQETEESLLPPNPPPPPPSPLLSENSENSFLDLTGN